MLYIAGGPMKTASTFLYQVMGEIVLLHGGRVVRPFGIDADMVRGWESEPNGVVIKLHEWHPALKGFDYRAVVTVRDPRDVFVSLVHFQQNTFEGTMASRAVQNWSAALSSWETKSGYVYGIGPGAEYLRYEDMMADPTRFVKVVGSYMDFHLHSDLAEYIARKWGREANRIRAGMALDQNERHFMSPRHIYSGEIGQWREALTAEQIAEVETFFTDDITRFRYDPS
jgi:hypothetical protein